MIKYGMVLLITFCILFVAGIDISRDQQRRDIAECVEGGVGFDASLEEVVKLCEEIYK